MVQKVWQYVDPGTHSKLQNVSTLCPKKRTALLWRYLRRILTDLQNSFTAGNLLNFLQNSCNITHCT